MPPVHNRLECAQQSWYDPKWLGAQPGMISILHTC